MRITVFELEEWENKAFEALETDHQLEFVTEYDFALNDNSPRALGRGRGYWNMGLRWRIINPVTVEVIVRDVLNNNRLNSTPSRELRFSYSIPL